MTDRPVDRWSGAEAYEAYVGRWSRRIAGPFLDWLDVPRGRRWADIGCGTGVLTEAIVRDRDPLSVVGVDPSGPFLDHARAAVTDPRVQFQSGTAAGTGLPDRACDVAVLGLVLNFVPDAPAALAEARRVLTDGGLLAAYVWDYADGMEYIRAFWDAAVSLDPAARALDQGARFPIAAPGPLATAFESAGLESVETRPIDVPTVFAAFDDLWLPFLGGTGSAPTYVAGLETDRADALRETLRSSVAAASDGSIHMTARAWAVRGREPAGRR